MANKLPVLFENSMKRREPLRKITNAVRLVNGAGDGLDGLIIDQYNEHFSIQVFNSPWLKSVEEISAFLQKTFPVEYIILKDRSANSASTDIKAKVLLGTSSKTIVEEHGVKFSVDLNDGLNTGLFLDMRANRKAVAGTCRNKRILNCFSYTCSFGLHARIAGASDVVNVDISKKILERGAENYALNGIEPSAAEFIRTHAGQYLERAVKKANRFDVIIIDPPSFARHEGKTFQIKRDLPGLIENAVAVLNPSGSIFVSSNYNDFTHGDIETMLAKASQGRKITNKRRIVQDTDFPGTNTFKESYLVGIWANL